MISLFFWWVIFTQGGIYIGLLFAPHPLAVPGAGYVGWLDFG
jgi:hypothetical protein